MLSNGSGKNTLREDTLFNGPGLTVTWMKVQSDLKWNHKVIQSHLHDLGEPIPLFVFPQLKTNVSIDSASLIHQVRSKPVA